MARLTYNIEIKVNNGQKAPDISIKEDAEKAKQVEELVRKFEVDIAQIDGVVLDINRRTYRNGYDAR